MIKYVPGQGFVKTYDRGDGTQGTMVLGSQDHQNRKNTYLNKQKAFMDQHGFDQFKDYSGDFQGLFGSENDTSSDMYYGGPNQNWRHALRDRLGKRQSGNYNMTGHYEGSLNTIDKGLLSQSFKRNNAIEDMYRSGYSKAQINDHMSGKINALEQGPDWADYNALKEEAMLDENKDASWMRKYFKGAPDSGFAAGNPFLDGGNAVQKGGFVEAYLNKKKEIANRPSVKSLFNDMENYSESQ